MDPELQQGALDVMGRASRYRQAGTDDGEMVMVNDGNSSGQTPLVQQDMPLEMVEKAIENACETLTTLGTNVIDFSFDSQHVLFSKVNEFVRDLRELDRCAKTVDVKIPLDVIDVIDKGRNPELCTFQMLESCAEASNVVRGKLSAIQHFRNELDKYVEDAQAQGCLQPVKEERPN